VVDDLPPELQALLASATRVEHTAPFPTPPMQGQPWDPPPGTSPELTAWIRFQLGELGMPDPRGCELRWVVLTVGRDGGGAVEVVTTAYVLPRANETEPAFAIAWNGMLYQAAAVGEPITLDDALAQTTPALAGVRSSVESALSKLVRRRGLVFLEAVSVTSPSIGLAALTRGTETSADYWTRCVEAEISGFCTRILAYASLERAAGGQARGDDTLGLASVSHAVAMRAAAQSLDVFTEAERPVFDDWETMDDLESDLQRRLRDPLDPVAMAAALASPRDHIDYLASELDETRYEWRDGVGHRVSPPGDALLQVGLDTIEALLNAASDERMVRGGQSLRVSDTAWTLMRLLVARHQPWVSLDACNGSTARGACARDLLAVSRSPVDGWMSVLVDGNARLRWGEAARRLARPPPVTCGAWTLIPRLTDRETTLWRDCRALDASLGDAARERLRVLLIERLREQLANGRLLDHLHSCDLAMSLLGLGGPGVLEALRDTSHACEGPRGPCECETDLTVARAAMGDETSLPEWAARLRQTGPRIGFATPRFAPGWLWPERADVQDAIREVLAGTPIRQAVVSHVGPVLGSPAVREWILGAMRSDDTIGEWRFHSNGAVGWGHERDECVGSCSGPVASTAPLLLRERVALRFVATDDAERAALTHPDPAVREAAVDRMAIAIEQLPWGAAAGPSPLYDWDSDCVYDDL
jgi:hypothetical protein